MIQQVTDKLVNRESVMIANKLRTIDMINDSNSVDDITAKKLKSSADSDTSGETVDDESNKLTKMSRAFKTIIEVSCFQCITNRCKLSYLLNSDRPFSVLVRMLIEKV